MKLKQLLAPLILLVLVSLRAEAYDGQDCTARFPVGYIMTDVIVVRPVGAIGTLVGGGLFLGLSPLTALASLAPPHDAFERVASILVGIPYGYTFVRPLGYFPNSCF